MRLSLTLSLLLVWGAAQAEAQAGVWERLVTRDGVRLDYGPDAAWRARGRRVAAERARLRQLGRYEQLNRGVAAARIVGSETSFAGVLRVPTILIAFKDTPLGSLPSAAQYDSVFYAEQPLAGRPYTVRTFYQEMSNGQLLVDGATFGWFVADTTRSYYLDACGTSSNAIDCATGRARMRSLFLAAIASLDASVDFRQFDNDGPDGSPGSGDDDGVVDVLQFVQPVVGGECGGRGIWAHKFSLSSLGASSGQQQTNDGVRVNPYHIVAGVGGAGCVAADTIMGIGTASHELGHGLGLPDLYDTGGQTEGIGEWGLMGSANFRSLISPGHLSAWSKEQLGWVNVRELTAHGTYSLGPVVLGDTVFLIRPAGANPRGEYFLLENKQAHGSDTANMLNPFCNNADPPRCRFAKGGGLAVWHIDSVKVTVGAMPSNTVNSGLTHGVSLIQADGFGDLEAKANRGDAGDVFPGRDNNTRLGRATLPAVANNADGGFAGFALTGITEDAPNGPVSFKYLLGFVVRASQSLAVVTVNGVSTGRYHDAPDSGTTLNLSFQSPQVSPDGRALFSFVSWSNDSVQSHAIVTTGGPDSVVANVAAQYQLLVQTAGGGGVTSSPSFGDLQTGRFLAAGTGVQLVATPPEGFVFDGWSGDTAAVSDTLRLTMQRPYALTATFRPALVVAAVSLPPGVMGAGYLQQLGATGGTGAYFWVRTAGSLPDGMVLLTDGTLTGVPEEIGTFNLTLQVRSGGQSQAVPIVLVVGAPVVGLEALLAHLVGAATPLTEDQVRYLDLLGNRNQKLDVGDFAAWVEETGVQPTAQIRAMLARRPGEKP